MSPRHKSRDSSSSSSSDSDSSGSKHHKNDKKNKKHDSDSGGFPSAALGGLGGIAATLISHGQSSHNQQYSQHPVAQTPFQGGQMHEKPPSSPPAYGNLPPPSGYRIPLSTDSAFADLQLAGQPPCMDADGRTPVFIGSALFQSSVHPCKIGPHLNPHALVPYGGGEHAHHGRYDLLPYDPHQMEFVRTAHGQIPVGRRPIEGGYEDNGAKLYHAIGVVNGVRVPGKTGEHLGGCNVPFGGQEHVIRDGYEILCWRY